MQSRCGTNTPDDLLRNDRSLIPRFPIHLCVTLGSRIVDRGMNSSVITRRWRQAGITDRFRCSSCPKELRTEPIALFLQGIHSVSQSGELAHVVSASIRYLSYRRSNASPRWHSANRERGESATSFAASTYRERNSVCSVCLTKIKNQWHLLTRSFLIG